MQRTAVIIGGGASGIFCAVNLARLAGNMRVLVLEKSARLLAKVSISGGGRCNVTHDCNDIREMAEAYPRGKHFVRKAFYSFFAPDTVEWFASRGVMLKTEKDGRMFPVTDSSSTIINCLLREADLYGVDIRIQSAVTGISRKDGKWEIELERAGRKEYVRSDLICVATGGYPKLMQYDWLRETGHSIVPPVPSLFTFNAPDDPITRLMGISVEKAEIRIPIWKIRETGPVLITHWGLSGPAVIRLSAWLAREMYACDYTTTAWINWLPSYTEQSFRETLHAYRNAHGAELILGRSPFGLANRLWEYLAQKAGVQNETWARLSAGVQNKLVALVTAYPLAVKGKTTFKDEFVTAGGITTSEINPETMESRLQPGLYFTGEILDVDGITGGYNFQHAWTSGMKAAIHMSRNTVS
jgi:hypothetical protein